MNHFDITEVIDEQAETIEKQARLISKLTKIVEQNELLEENPEDENIGTT